MHNRKTECCYGKATMASLCTAEYSYKLFGTAVKGMTFLITSSKLADNVTVVTKYGIY
jgi:hypothetical protein